MEKKLKIPAIIILTLFIFLNGMSLGFTIDRCSTKQEMPKFEAKKPQIQEKIKKTSKVSFKNKTPEKGLFEALLYYGIYYPEIVYRQAILETGFFTSDICLKYNNLFGLYNSKTKSYYKFSHWTESVKAYVSMIQYKYEEGDYYAFLEKIGYAQDADYVKKLKNIKY